MKTPAHDSLGRSSVDDESSPRAGSVIEADLQSMERSLIRNGSIELTSGIESIGAATGLLPAAMPVFVPSLPKRPITGNLEALSALKRNGFEPVPHLAARRLLSREELQKFLDVAVREIGVRTIFLIGGDVDTCSGPYESAEDVLRSGILQDAGIASVGIPGYPEPHPRISDTELERSLLAKVELMARAGLDAFVVSQFSLDAGRLVAFCGQMRRRFPNLPLFAGIPGPTNVAKLMKYAKVCGVGASMRALKSMGLKAARIGNRATSNQQVRALAEYCLNHSQSPVRGVHLFSFGGFRASAEWIGERTGTDVARRSIT